MKKLSLITIILLLWGLGVYAQDKEDQRRTNLGRLTQADRLVMDVFTDIWLKYPSDSMDIKKINRGANISIVREFPFGSSNFSFATGLGISCHNIYSDAIPVKNYTIDTSGVKIFNGTTVFKPIPKYSPDGRQEIHYKNNKFTVVYADIPVEFRFRLKNNAFKFYLGGKFGIMLSNHSKYSGDNFNENYPTPTIKIKEYGIDNVEKFRYGITVRTGWKWIQAYGYYSLSRLFKKDKGPEMYPLSVGVTISPY